MWVTGSGQLSEERVCEFPSHYNNDHIEEIVNDWCERVSAACEWATGDWIILEPPLVDVYLECRIEKGKDSKFLNGWWFRVSDYELSDYYQHPITEQYMRDTTALIYKLDRILTLEEWEDVKKLLSDNGVDYTVSEEKIIPAQLKLV